MLNINKRSLIKSELPTETHLLVQRNNSVRTVPEANSITTVASSKTMVFIEQGLHFLPVSSKFTDCFKSPCHDAICRRRHTANRLLIGKNENKLVVSALKRLTDYSGDLSGRIDRICSCSTRMAGILARVKRGSITKRKRCKDRLCSICAAILRFYESNRRKALLEEALAEKDGQLFLATLSFRRRKFDTLPDLLNAISSCWAKFANTSFKRNMIGDYMRQTHIEYTEEKGWNVHIHLLFRLSSKAGNMSKTNVTKTLVSAWKDSCSKNKRASRINHCERIDDRYSLEETAGRLANYLSKSPLTADKRKNKDYLRSHELPANRLAEYTKAIKGCQLSGMSAGWSSRSKELSGEYKSARKNEGDIFVPVDWLGSLRKDVVEKNGLPKNLQLTQAHVASIVMALLDNEEKELADDIAGTVVLLNNTTLLNHNLPTRTKNSA